VITVRIGPDDNASNPPRLRWDDHVFSTAAAWPGDLGIVALVPTTGGFYDNIWTRLNCADSTSVSCVRDRPPVSASGVRSTLQSARQTFCFQQNPAARGVTGPILGVKTIVGARDDEMISTPAGLFIRTGGCNNASGMDRSPEVNFDPGTSVTGFGRFDEVSPASGAAWSAPSSSPWCFGSSWREGFRPRFLPRAAAGGGAAG
jgi:hypothetical protein